MVEPARLAVALACGVNEGETGRLPHALVLHAPDKPLFERDGDGFCEPDADKTTRCDCVTGADQAHRLRCGPDLVGVLRPLQARSSIRVHGAPRLKRNAATKA